MGLYERKDSKYYWMLLERQGLPAKRVSTGVLVDAPTPGQRRDQKNLADQIYKVEMGKLAKAGYQLTTVKPKISFDEFSTWFETNILAKHRGKDKELSRLRSLRSFFKDYLLTAIDITLVHEYLTKRVEQDRITARSANREVDDLKNILTHAVPRYLDQSPILGMRRLRTADFEARALTREEYARLLEACETTEETAVVVTAVNTLLRLSSLLNLEWTHDKNTFLVTLDAKVKQEGVPINSEVRKALDDLPHTGKHIFANHVGRRGGGPTARKNYLIRMFEKLCARAKVPHGRQADGVTFHSLRNTGATWALHRHGNLKAVMKLGGWKTVPQCLKYVVVISADVHEAAESITGGRVLKLQRR